MRWRFREEVRFDSCRSNRSGNSPDGRAVGLLPQTWVKTMQINNLSDATNLVHGFYDTMKASKSTNEAEKEGYDLATQRRNYEVIARAFALAQSLMGNEQVLAELYASFGVDALKHTNPFGPMVRVLFRQKQNDGTTKFNDSAWKQANILRFIRDEGWAVDRIPDELANLERVIDDVKRTKLKAAELADREKYGEGKDEAEELARAFEYLLTTEGVGTVADGQFEVKDKGHGSLVTLAANWDSKRGVWVIRGVVGENQRNIRKALKRPAVEAYKARGIELLKRLAAANVETEQANLSATERQLIAEMQIGDFVWPVPVQSKATVKSKAKAKDAVVA